ERRREETHPQADGEEDRDDETTDHVADRLTHAHGAAGHRWSGGQPGSRRWRAVRHRRVAAAPEAHGSGSLTVNVDECHFVQTRQGDRRGGGRLASTALLWAPPPTRGPEAPHRAATASSTRRQRRT